MEKRFPPTPESTREDAHGLPRALPKLQGLVVGELVGFTESGEPLVQFEGAPAGSSVRARMTSPVESDDVGHAVALLFEGGDPSCPIVIGRIEDRRPLAREAEVSSEGSSPFQVSADGERLEIQAGREIVLRVGQASITLTRAGKILIRGAYLLSRSSGVNRIKGGSIQLN